MVLYVTTCHGYTTERELTVDYGNSYARHPNISTPLNQATDAPYGEKRDITMIYLSENPENANRLL